MEKTLPPSSSASTPDRAKANAQFSDGTIDVRAVSKSFGSFAALTDVNLTVRSGELLALLGPSGSGKTTLLRIIAGLESPDDGSDGIYFGGEEVTHRSAKDRGVGFVFQHYALFRHMTVFDNVAFGLSVRPAHSRPPREELRRRVRDLLGLVQLDGLEGRLPSQLSGGQRQRVALARALAVEPKVLLLDEPFGALDAKVRKELRRWVRKLHEEIHVTSIFVTHDQEEAMELADRLVIMNRGRIEQSGTADEVYEAPANPFVFRFLGGVNTFSCAMRDGRADVGGRALDTGRSDLNGDDVRAFVRPHELEIQREKSSVQPSLAARVVHIQPIGPLFRIELTASSSSDLLEVEVTREAFHRLGLARNDRVYLTAKKVHLFRGDARLSILEEV